MTETSFREHFRFTETHEWVRKVSEGVWCVGITDHAQHLLGDVVYVDLPKLKTFSKGRPIAVLESVKAAADVYAPLSGTVLLINEGLLDHPEWINQDPYGEGWLFQMVSTDTAEWDTLLSADQYRAQLG